ncbi:ketosteroid isomerase-like protein [Nocardioides thalensis]|uniref:Ketosteroid isomerase-like protein n=1 Tax=Nocardioides thalensis TaxID=1914755 RepID=A0A853BX56_9ACTN|nr:ketosteroid isomerase-like protein [Nocardioides thalensis]
MTNPGDLVRSYYRAVDAGDIEGVLECFAEDARYDRGGYPPLQGAADLRRFYAHDRVIASGRHRVERILVDGRTAAALGTFQGTSKSGDALDIRFADFFVFHDDLIGQRTTYFLTAGV